MIQSPDRARPPGRNDPCPCGSGKKYKRCCLLLEATAAPRRQLEDVVAEVFAAEEMGDRTTTLRLLEEARQEIHHPDLDGMLVERLVECQPEEAEQRLRQWWETEHDRFS